MWLFLWWNPGILPLPPSLNNHFLKHHVVWALNMKTLGSGLITAWQRLGLLTKGPRDSTELRHWTVVGLEGRDSYVDAKPRHNIWELGFWYRFQGTREEGRFCFKNWLGSNGRVVFSISHGHHFCKGPCEQLPSPSPVLGVGWGKGRVLMAIKIPNLRSFRKKVHSSFHIFGMSLIVIVHGEEKNLQSRRNKKIPRWQFSSLAAKWNLLTSSTKSWCPATPDIYLKISSHRDWAALFLKLPS